MYFGKKYGGSKILLKSSKIPEKNIKRNIFWENTTELNEN